MDLGLHKQGLLSWCPGLGHLAFVLIWALRGHCHLLAQPCLPTQLEASCGHRSPPPPPSEPAAERPFLLILDTPISVQPPEIIARKWGCRDRRYSEDGMTHERKLFHSLALVWSPHSTSISALPPSPSPRKLFTNRGPPTLS